MFNLLFRKIRKTKWMVLCLLIGFLMAAGMMSSVPIYMDASLQRLLIKDIYAVERTFTEAAPLSELLKELDELPGTVSSRVHYLPIPLSSEKTVVSDSMLYLSKGGVSGSVSARTKLTAMTDIEKHISVISGEMYSESGIAGDGAFEAVASETAMRALGITLGETYSVRGADSGRESFDIRIVGVFEQTDPSDVFFSEKTDGYVSSVFVSMDCYKNELLTKGHARITDLAVRCTLDYRKMDMNDLAFATNALDEDREFFESYGYKFIMGVQSIFRQYAEEAEKLTRMLWILQIPAMVMLAFYLFMVSRLNVEQEKNEIAVFKSRGASSLQIFGLYAAESALLGAVTLIAAPFIGLVFCRFLGVSDGFLEFVNRTGINAKITSGAVWYALIAVIVFFCATMIPIIPASKLSIVQYKQSKTRVVKASLWEKTCIDLILIAVSARDSLRGIDGGDRSAVFRVLHLPYFRARAAFHTYLSLSFKPCVSCIQTLLDTLAVYGDNHGLPFSGRQREISDAVPCGDFFSRHILRQYRKNDKRSEGGQDKIFRRSGHNAHGILARSYRRRRQQYRHRLYRARFRAL